MRDDNASNVHETSAVDTPRASAHEAAADPEMARDYARFEQLIRDENSDAFRKPGNGYMSNTELQTFLVGFFNTRLGMDSDDTAKTIDGLSELFARRSEIEELRNSIKTAETDEKSEILSTVAQQHTAITEDFIEALQEIISDTHAHARVETTTVPDVAPAEQGSAQTPPERAEAMVSESVQATGGRAGYGGVEQAEQTSSTPEMPLETFRERVADAEGAAELKEAVDTRSAEVCTLMKEKGLNDASIAEHKRGTGALTDIKWEYLKRDEQDLTAYLSAVAEGRMTALSDVVQKTKYDLWQRYFAHADAVAAALRAYTPTEPSDDSAAETAVPESAHASELDRTPETTDALETQPTDHAAPEAEATDVRSTDDSAESAEASAVTLEDAQNQYMNSIAAYYGQKRAENQMTPELHAALSSFGGSSGMTEAVAEAEAVYTASRRTAVAEMLRSGKSKKEAAQAYLLDVIAARRRRRNEVMNPSDHESRVHAQMRRAADGEGEHKWSERIAALALSPAPEHADTVAQALSTTIDDTQREAPPEAESEMQHGYNAQQETAAALSEIPTNEEGIEEGHSTESQSQEHESEHSPVSAETAEPSSDLYEVQKGDNLWNILEGEGAERRMSSVLARIPEVHRSDALDALFDRVDEDESFRREIGMHGNTAEQIYYDIDKEGNGELLNIAVLERELEHIATQNGYFQSADEKPDVSDTTAATETPAQSNEAAAQPKTPNVSIESSAVTQEPEAEPNSAKQPEAQLTNVKRSYIDSHLGKSEKGAIFGLLPDSLNAYDTLADKRMEDVAAMSRETADVSKEQWRKFVNMLQEASQTTPPNDPDETLEAYMDRFIQDAFTERAVNDLRSGEREEQSETTKAA